MARTEPRRRAAARMAAGARIPDDRRADAPDPHTRETRLGERLDSGRGRPWRRDDDDRGDG